MAGDITGKVYNDLNANGVDDPTENGLPGWTVFVDANGDGIFNSGELFAVTDGRGEYAITGVPAGSDVPVYEIPQDGFSPTPGFSEHQNVRVRDGREVRAKFPNITAPVTTGRISGVIFADANENGVKDPGEEGLEGWTVFVDVNGDGVLNLGEPTENTNTDGDYLIAGVTAGSATVYEIPSGGYQPIVGGLFPLDGASDHRTVSVPAGGSVGADFANLIPPVGTIRGTVWNDANGDGARGVSESARAGQTVFVDLNLNGVQEGTEPARVTDSFGNYFFGNIHTGTYRVTEVLSDGWISADTRSAAVTTGLAQGGVQIIDFFNLVPITGSISGLIWNDRDGNGAISSEEEGLAGRLVFLDQNGNSLLEPTEPQTLTAADGTFSFSAVPYGNSLVRLASASGWVATNPGGGAASVHLLNGENRTAVNFGSREAIGTIQGTVWNDANGDGIRGPFEGGAADRTVYLDLNRNGARDESDPAALTDATGGYRFDRVPVGAYLVVDATPTGWISSLGKPSSVNTTLSIGGVNVVDFFSLTPVPGSISGSVWNDVDGNSVRGATEPALAGWEVYIDQNANGIFDLGETIALTDLDGNYTLPAAYGNQTVREVVQPGFTSTTHAGGASTFLLLNGENRTGLSFGNHEAADYVISGSAFFDENHNGVRDAAERGLSGITVYLDTNNNSVLDAGEPSQITLVDQFFTPSVNEAGNYSFTHLARGAYKVREIVPDELSATSPESRVLSLTVGPTSALSANFANLYRANEIHGVVFDDVDADGVWDSSETTHAGVPIYLDLDRDDTLDLDEPRAVTGDDGAYAFVGLTPGAYVVRVQPGVTGLHTYPNTGGGVLWPQGASHPAVGLVSPAEISASLAAGESMTRTVTLTLPGAGGGGLTNLVDVFLLFDDTGSFTGNSPLVRAAFPTIISSLQAALPGIDLGFGVGRLEEYGGFASEFASGRPYILNQPIISSEVAGFSASIQAALDRMTPGYGGDAPETDIEALYQVVTGLGFDGNNNGSTSDSGPAGLAATQLNPGVSGDVPSFQSFIADPANGVLPASGSVGGAGFRPGALPIILTATDTGFAYQPKGETTIFGDGVSLPVSSLTQASRPSTPFGYGAGLQETVTALNALGALVIGLGTNPEATFAPRQGLEALATLTGAVNRTPTTIANGTSDPIAPGDPFYFQITSGFGATVADGVVNAIQNAVTNVAMNITLRASDPRVRIINHTGVQNGIGAGQTATFDVEFVGDGRPRRFDLQFVREGTNVVLGSIPVVLGVPMAGEGYQYDELEDGEIHRSSHFGNYVVNVAPSFDAGGDQVLSEDAGPQLIAAWATNISPGPATESRQSVTFQTSSDNPGLFSQQPTISPSGELTFTPAANASGVALVTVLARDNGGVGLSGADTSVSQTFRIEFTPVNDAPTAGDDAFTVSRGGSLTVAVSGLLANDVDMEGDALTAVAAALPAHGILALNPDGSFNYTPEPGFVGSDSFSYQAHDGLATSNIATVTISVEIANAAPVARADVFSVLEDSELTLGRPGVLGNDTDADGDLLSAVLISTPTHGTLTLNADGSLNYIPSPNFFGTDAFSYRADDGLAVSNEAIVTINVIQTNRAPIAGNDSFSTPEDTPLALSGFGLLANDSDADGDPLAVLLVTGPSHGTLTLAADGSFLYTPVANFYGSDSFSYLLSDGDLNSNIAVVSLTVSAVNDAPVARDDSFAATEDVVLTIFPLGVLANDTDAEGSLLSAELVSGPAHGELTFHVDGSFTYIPTANYNGSDSFTYRVSDGSLLSNVAAVSLSVAAVNDAPTVGNDAFVVNEDNSLSVAAPGVLGNDIDVESGALRAVLVSGPAHGVLSLNLNGSFVYTPVANYSGPDSFTYQASDGLANSTIATVAITVTPVNDVPVVGNDAYSTSANTPLTISARGVLQNDSDADGDVLAAVLAGGPSNGALSLNPDGSFTYTPAIGFSGTDTFHYRAADALTLSATALVTITVTPPAPPATKFYVVDGDTRGSYRYAADGSPIGSSVLNKADSKPRGIASNATGTTQWVVDGGGAVFVYDNGGSLLGQWSPQGVGKPEGITVWGNNLWLVDPTSDRVYFFSGGASLRAGKVNPTSSFALNSGNLNSTDLVTDGAHLWVTNDTPTADKVFRYTISGALEGSWTLSATNPSPTGITLDPVNVGHLWVVDPSTDRVYQYDGATTRLAGAQEPSVTFALAASNTNPQGIADPPPVPETQRESTHSSRAATSAQDRNGVLASLVRPGQFEFNFSNPKQPSSLPSRRSNVVQPDWAKWDSAIHSFTADSNRSFSNSLTDSEWESIFSASAESKRQAVDQFESLDLMFHDIGAEINS